MIATNKLLYFNKIHSSKQRIFYTPVYQTAKYTTLTKTGSKKQSKLTHSSTKMPISLTASNSINLTSLQTELQLQAQRAWPLRTLQCINEGGKREEMSPEKISTKPRPEYVTVRAQVIRLVKASSEDISRPGLRQRSTAQIYRPTEQLLKTR